VVVGQLRVNPFRGKLTHYRECHWLDCYLRCDAVSAEVRLDEGAKDQNKDQRSITAEEFHSLMASSQKVLLLMFVIRLIC
jgi:hypothetical protein